MIIFRKGPSCQASRLGINNLLITTNKYNDKNHYDLYQVKTKTMNARSYLISILFFMSLLGLFSFCKSKGKRPSVETIEHGPFTIQRSRITERRFDMNRGRFYKSAYSSYQIIYQGRPIVFPAALEVNTGYSSVWKAFIVQDAPRPAIIAGSQSLYLITEEDGKAGLVPLNEQNSNVASLQWLDAENGKPGPKQEIYISEDTSANDYLEGGDYLLVNQNTVLHVPDLTIHSFRKSMDLTDGYYAVDVAAFSPGKEEVVFVGNKNSEERYDKFLYALLVYNFKTNAAYAVPFDQTETRLYSPEYITPDWLNTYFEWRPSGTGALKLEKRDLDPLPYWEGFINWEFAYQLIPVKAAMQQTLVDFLKTTFPLTDADIELESDTGNHQVYRIQLEGRQFSLYYFKDMNSVSFNKHFSEPDSEEIRGVVKRVGETFNEELRRGKYQDLFTGY